RQVAGLFDHRPGGRLDVAAHLVGDDVGERRLADAGGAIQQDVVEGLAALAGGFGEDVEIALGFPLAYVLAQPLGAQAQLELTLLVARRGSRDDSVFGHCIDSVRRCRGFYPSVYHKLWPCRKASPNLVAESCARSV